MYDLKVCIFLCEPEAARPLFSPICTPFLRDVGNIPEDLEAFIICMNGRTRASAHCFMTCVGAGSSTHDGNYRSLD